MEIVEALLERGVRLRGYDQGRHLASCPQCSGARHGARRRDACLSVLIDGKGFVCRCHHCGWRSGWLAQKHEGGLNAKFRVADEGKFMPINKPQGAVIAEEAKQWLASRHIPLAIAERYELWSERGALAFPFMDGGEIVNVQYRRWPKGYSMAPAGKLTYWGLQHVPPVPEEVVITEGMMDALACATAGVVAVSVPNGSPGKVSDGAALSYVGDSWDRFKDAKRIIIAVDNDAPGCALREELARRYGRERCWFVDWPAPHKDANDVLIADGAAALAAILGAAKPFPVRFVARMSDYADEIMDLYVKGTAKGLSTGFATLDALYTIRPGELTIVTGYPGMGKSEFADQLLINLCHKNNQTAAVCSFENPPVEHGVKLIEKLVGRPFFAIDGEPRPRATVGEVSGAIDWLTDHFYMIRMGEDSPTIDHILEAARGAVGRYGISYLVIDPYNELARPTDLNEVAETEYISQLLGRLTRFAKTHSVHVFFIAHPRKPYIPEKQDEEIGPPSLYAISGSQNWANKADIGLVVHRPSIYDTAVEIHVKKVRFKATGKPGSVSLQYDKSTGIYFEPNEFDMETVGVA